MHNHDHNHEHHHDTGAVAVNDIPAEYLVTCPVTGDAIDTREAEKLGHFRDVNGKRIYFCCATCVKLFDENPEEYTHTTHESHELTLIEKEHLVDNVWAFRFTPERHLSWLPGQFIRVEIPHNNPDSEGTKRWFTISSIPPDGFLQITTRITDTTFKQALAGLPMDGKIQLIEQPHGDFVWQDSDKPLVLIAGGIGITPYYSILKARGLSDLPVSATLIYSGRTDDLPFKQEFDEASKRHPELSVQYVIGEQLTAEKLTQIVPDLASSSVYISGPEPMVEVLGKALVTKGLPEESLHQDFFPHYTETTY